MNLRLQYAPEVECALVGLLWHKPEHLPGVLRELNPAIHVFEPANRILLEAIDAVYSDLNALDWASVIDYLRQTGQIDELGGLGRLNEIYARPGYSSLVDYYVTALKEYAAIRSPDSDKRPPYFLNVGRALLLPNKSKTNERAADFVGAGRIAGHRYAILAWLADAPAGGTELRLRFEFQPDHKHGPDTGAG